MISTAALREMLDRARKRLERAQETTLEQAEAILKEQGQTELPVTALERWQRDARAHVEDLEKRLAAPDEP